MLESTVTVSASNEVGEVGTKVDLGSMSSHRGGGDTSKEPLRRRTEPGGGEGLSCARIIRLARADEGSRSTNE